MVASSKLFNILCKLQSYESEIVMGEETNIQLLIH